MSEYTRVFEGYFFIDERPKNLNYSKIQNTKSLRNWIYAKVRKSGEVFIDFCLTKKTAEVMRLFGFVLQHGAKANPNDHNFAR